jgi:hypothetical protein
MTNKKPKTFKLSEEARAALTQLANHFGNTETGVLESLLRQEQRKLEQRQSRANTKPLPTAATPQPHTANPAPLPAEAAETEAAGGGVGREKETKTG